MDRSIITFDEFINQAWNDHAKESAVVAARLNESLTLVQNHSNILALGHLATHVFGDHLGQWESGIQFLSKLDRLPSNNEESKAALFRNTESLKLAANLPCDRSLWTESDSIRILASASAALAGQNRIEKASDYFQQALNAAVNLAPLDPANRALAVTGNNLACSLEEREERTHLETDLMILAAKTARKYWELAGTWIHVERAEFRLAHTYLKAGNKNQALHHASECFRICEENKAEADEMKYAHEVVALVKNSV